MMWYLPPIVGSLFSWKSLFTNLRTRDDYTMLINIPPLRQIQPTFPTAASPSKTSLTLLLGFGPAGADSGMASNGSFDGILYALVVRMESVSISNSSLTKKRSK